MVNSTRTISVVPVRIGRKCIVSGRPLRPLLIRLSHRVEGSPDFGEPLRKWRDIDIGKLVDILAFECRVR